MQCTALNMWFVSACHSACFKYGMWTLLMYSAIRAKKNTHKLPSLTYMWTPMEMETVGSSNLYSVISMAERNFKIELIFSINQFHQIITAMASFCQWLLFDKTIKTSKLSNILVYIDGKWAFIIYIESNNICRQLDDRLDSSAADIIDTHAISIALYHMRVKHTNRNSIIFKQTPTSIATHVQSNFLAWLAYQCSQCFQYCHRIENQYLLQR